MANGHAPSDWNPEREPAKLAPDSLVDQMHKLDRLLGEINRSLLSPMEVLFGSQTSQTCSQNEKSPSPVCISDVVAQMRDQAERILKQTINIGERLGRMNNDPVCETSVDGRDRRHAFDRH